jgi:hypothetical protein
MITPVVRKVSIREERENKLGLSFAKFRLKICMSAETELILTIEF